MAKTKEAIPPKRGGTKTVEKSSVPPKSKHSSLSEEKVIDSESEDESSSEESGSEGAQSPAKSASVANANASHSHLGRTNSVLSGNGIEAQDSEDSEDEESSQQSRVGEQKNKVKNKSPATKKYLPLLSKTNGVKRKAEAQSSSSADSSEDEDEEISSHSEAKRAKMTRSKKSGESSSEEESSSSEEDSESLDGAGSGTEAVEKGSEFVSTSSATHIIPARPFEPPQGYVPLASTTPNTDNAFSNQNLDGKQLWHVTAPSNLPLSSITEIAFSAVEAGTTVIEHKGLEYALNEKRDSQTPFDCVLIPGKTGYERIEKIIARKLHFEQKIVLPNLSTRQADVSTGSNAAGDVALPSVSHVRPQPKGLRMRYKPPGFGIGNPGRIGSGSEGADEEDLNQSTTPSLQFPKTLGVHGVSINQEKGQMRHAGIEKKPGKKKRKEPEAVLEAETAMNGVTGDSEPKKVFSKKHRSDTEERPKEPQTSIVDEISAEEKAKRKELKRQRKEAKLKAKEGK